MIPWLGAGHEEVAPSSRRPRSKQGRQDVGATDIFRGSAVKRRISVFRLSANFTSTPSLSTRSHRRDFPAFLLRGAAFLV